MHIRNSLFLLVFCVSAPALAAEKPAYCRYVDKYIQPSGVEYQPGVDVHGKSVAPADLNQSPNGIYEDIVIPVEIDLINRYNLGAPNGTELKPVVADMTIHKDGRIDYNGHDLTPQAIAICEERAEIPIESPKTAPAPENGQGDADDISSGGTNKGKLIEGHSP